MELIRAEVLAWSEVPGLEGHNASMVDVTTAEHSDGFACGFVRMEDRKGVEQDIPLVNVSVGIATTSRRAFAHYGEAVAVATEMKQFAKRDGGSSYAVDRRAP